MSLEIQYTLAGDVPQAEADQLKNLSKQQIAEATVCGLYAAGLITSRAGRVLLDQDRREFYEMLARNQVPISGPETDEDIEDNRAVYQKDL